MTSSLHDRRHDLPTTTLIIIRASRTASGYENIPESRGKQVAWEEGLSISWPIPWPRSRLVFFGGYDGPGTTNQEIELPTPSTPDQSNLLQPQASLPSSLATSAPPRHTTSQTLLASSVALNQDLSSYSRIAQSSSAAGLPDHGNGRRRCLLSGGCCNEYRWT